MRIQHNISAMNSYRNFSANNSKLSKNLEKLSTGYKINRAGDDAAGLAISEKMRAQITGLEGATKNAKDGISLIQTAEGALTEVHDMLNRMTTLAEQSANGTYDNELDRNQLQKEVQALKDEIDRIADSTNFNGLKLLDGSLAENTEAVNNEKQLVTFAAGSKNANVTSSTMTQKFVNATGDSYEATAGTLGAASKFSAFKINFSDKNGAEYELTLAGDQADDSALATNAALAAALNGTQSGLTLTSTNGVDADEALQAFRNTFTVSTATGTGTDGKITFTVKDDAVGAKLLSFEAKTGQTDQKTAVDSLAAVGLTKTDGLSAGYEIGLGATPAAGDTVSVGDKVYEFVTNATDQVKTAGATAVKIGTTNSQTTNGVASTNATDNSTANLYNRLKEDGYDVSLDTRTAGSWKIRFTDMDQVSEAQTGGAVSTTSDYLAIHDQVASKQTTTFSATNAGTDFSADTQYSVDIAYVDADGNNRAKSISFTTDSTASQTAATVGTAISDALKADDDMNGMFDISVDNAGKITLTAKSTDNSLGQFASVAVKDTTGAAKAVETKITAGVNDGKAIELKNADGTARNIVAGDTVTVNGKTYEFAASGSSKIGDGNVRVLVGSDGKDSLKNLSQKLTDDGVLNSYDADTGKIVMRDTDNILEQTSGGLSLQIGDTAESYNKLTVSVTDMHAKSIGIGDVDISTQDGASAALDKIKSAINNVSDVRGTLGALQNRLDHTINNLGVMRENIQNAESTIRDTDVAEEMMTYTKNNILNQSAQAMLAQANQLPQGVLQLLG